MPSPSETAGINLPKDLCQNLSGHLFPRETSRWDIGFFKKCMLSDPFETRVSEISDHGVQLLT